MGNHALLSASSSHRWLNCPPSARLGENYEDKGSDFAAEGTDAHSLCEHKLKTALGIPSEDPTENLTWYNEEMEECASGYAAYVLELLAEAKKVTTDPIVLIEQRLDYVRTVTRKTFAAAVARVMCPGIKFDCVPVLDGEQGIGKSSIVKDLVTPEYYSESLSLTDMDDKAGAEKLQGFWVVEIGELAGMKKADIEKVKSFLSTSDDKYRPSYGRVVESHPRQCIIIGTVNGERGYLRDITGNRRFWIIKVHQKTQKQNWHFTQADRDQFWAEAKAIWESGEKLYLEGDILAESEKAQRNAMEVDERVGMVEEYLNTLLPEGWDSMDVYARRSYLSGDPTAVKGTVERTTVSNAEIWCECFGKNLSELKATDSYAIAALMTQIPGWKRGAAAKRLPLYGKQRIYEKG